MKNIAINLLGAFAGRNSTRNKGGVMKSLFISFVSTAMIKRFIRR